MTALASPVASQGSDVIARSLRGDLSWADSAAWDWAAIAADARYHGVDLLLWHQFHADPACPPALVERLGAAVSAEAARSALRLRELAAVVRALDERGVDAIALKGTALALSCYAQPWLRPRLDTDLLVRRAAFERAGEALASAGYARSTTFSTGDLVSHQVSFERTDTYGIEHTVDLHWKALNPQLLAEVIVFDELWQDANEIRQGDVRLRVPSPVWSLLLACVHRLAHHQRQPRLIWIYDIHLLAARFRDADWLRVLEIAAGRGVSALCADGLESARRLVGTRVPPDVVAALAQRGRAEVSRVYVGRAVRRVDVLRQDLRVLSRWSDRARLLREHAFPPAAFMQTRYGARGRWLLPALYAHRLLTGALRWIRS